MSLFGQIKKHQTGISPGLPCIPWTCLIAFHYCIFVQQTPLVLVIRKIFDRLWQNVHPTLHEIVSYDRGSDRFPQVPRQRQLFRGNGHQGAIQRILAVIGWPVSGALDNFQVDRSTRTWDGDSFQGESNSKWEERCMKASNMFPKNYTAFSIHPPHSASGGKPLGNVLERDGKHMIAAGRYLVPKKLCCPGTLNQKIRRK